MGGNLTVTIVNGDDGKEEEVVYYPSRNPQGSKSVMAHSYSQSTKNMNQFDLTSPYKYDPNAAPVYQGLATTNS